MINLRTGLVRSGAQDDDSEQHHAKQIPANNNNNKEEEEEETNGGGSDNRKISASWKAEWEETEFEKQKGKEKASHEINARLISITSKVGRDLARSFGLFSILMDSRFTAGGPSSHDIPPPPSIFLIARIL